MANRRRYTVTFTAGQTSGKYEGYPSLKAAKAAAKRMAAGNCQIGGTASWSVFPSDNSNEPSAQGTIRQRVHH